MREPTHNDNSARGHALLDVEVAHGDVGFEVAVRWKSFSPRRA